MDLRSALVERARLDPELQRFGASTHRYRLNPPLAPEQRAAFEALHGVRLPAEYAEFLTSAGNGGAGPFYGIYPLGEGWEGLAGSLSAPFPFREPWNLPTDPPESFASDEEEERWNADLDARYWFALQGAFPICHHGCALRTWLVVTGPERGRVWYDARAEGGGLRPHEDAQGRRLGFLDWYRGWLAEG